MEREEMERRLLLIAKPNDASVEEVGAILAAFDTLRAERDKARADATARSQIIGVQSKRLALADALAEGVAARYHQMSERCATELAELVATYQAKV